VTRNGAAAGRKTKAKPRKRRRTVRRRRRLRTAAGVVMILAILAAGLTLHLYVEITTTFKSRVWDLPSTIYSAPLALERGSRIAREHLVRRLERCGYAAVSGDPQRPGQYRVAGGRLDVFLRELQAPDLEMPPRYRTIGFKSETIRSIHDRSRRPRARVWFEPELLATMYGAEREEREVLPYDEFPEMYVKAVLAAEDARFFSHRGIDLRAIARALLANLRSGRIVQGASTISQQTVKNLFLSHERTWWRKIREIPMALILDLKYPKERIMEVYLNEVYLGQRGSISICGAQAAARFYFGRDLSDLTQGESALLAGMIRYPGGCNPFAYPDRAVARRNQVLAAMRKLEWIEPSAAARARAEPLALGSGKGGFGRARYVVDFVRADLERYYGADAIQQAGHRVFTTIDTAVQQAATESLAEGLSRLENGPRMAHIGKKKGELQGCVVVTDPGTGAILALVGGRDYRNTQFNRAVDARRQPGSCFKPFVYLAAFQEAERFPRRGLTLASLLDDAPLELVSGGRTWKPANHDRKFRGKVSVRYALENSLNVPTVRAGLHVGLDRVAGMAQRCGISGELHRYPSLALGSQEVTPLELATAYGTLAAGGVRAAPRIIEEVRNRDGVRLERRRSERERAVSPRAAFLITDALRGVMTHGTASASRALGYSGDAAGKTGTTDDGRDAWFVGYRPDLLALVWVGYDDNSVTGLAGATGALPIWVEIMNRISPYRRAGLFRRPDGIIRRRIDPASGMLAVSRCPERRNEWFAAGTEPDEECPDHSRKRKKGWFRRLFGDR